MIIKTNTYNIEDVIKILNIRANTESIKLTKVALDYLGSIGDKTSLRFIPYIISLFKYLYLRFAAQLITPAQLLAQTQGRDEIEK